jgi:hypothetical protein
MKLENVNKKANQISSKKLGKNPQISRKALIEYTMYKISKKIALTNYDEQDLKDYLLSLTEHYFSTEKL